MCSTTYYLSECSCSSNSSLPSVQRPVVTFIQDSSPLLCLCLRCLARLQPSFLLPLFWGLSFLCNTICVTARHSLSLSLALHGTELPPHQFRITIIAVQCVGEMGMQPNLWYEYGSTFIYGQNCTYMDTGGLAHASNSLSHALMNMSL